MGKLNLTDEDRQARSERMKRLHAEGRAGAEFGKLGGRPRKKRATEVAAEKIAEKGQELFDILWDKVNSENEKISMDAIKQAYALDELNRKTEAEEEVRYEQLKHNDLAELVIGNLFELVKSGQIDLGEIVEGEIVEDRPTLGSGEVD